MGLGHAAAAQAPVDFEREVRPILEASCYACHGAEKDKAELRLDVRERAFEGAYAGTSPVLVPGKALESSLYLRLITEDDDERMPQKAPRLAPEQIELVRRWIDEGARWPDEHAGSEVKGVGHWAYRAPTRPTLPAVRDKDWVREPLDAFVLAALERNGLRPAPQADRATLLRRLSLDLTGLAPSLEELDAFERDQRPEAYARAVERLLASPHFGERFARPWLDMARYADTQGYEKDARRTQWPYRDWVVDAFNANLPFDQFTLQQLAGDLLPGAGPREKLATGFHRNTMLNEEGGIDEEEFRSDAVIDRVNTTGAVWLGSTFACAQCHDHKYDPVSQREYFGLYAIFNSTADGGRASGPTAPALDGEGARKLEELRSRRATLAQRMDAPDAERERAQAAWEREQRAALEGTSAWRVLRPTAVALASRRPTRVLEDDSVLLSGVAPPAEVVELTFAPGAGEADELSLEALRDPSLPGGGPGESDGGEFLLSAFEAYVLRAGGAQEQVKFATASATFEASRRAHRAVHALDPDNESGWSTAGAPAELELRATFTPAAPLRFEDGDRLHLVLKHVSMQSRRSLGRMRVALRRAPLAREPFAGLSSTPWRMLGPWKFESRDQLEAFEPPARAEHLARAPHAASYPGGRAWRERPELIERVPHRLDGPNQLWVFERTLHSERARRLELFVGADDAFTLWLDGRRVASSNEYTTFTGTPLRVEVELAQGANRLLLEVANHGGAGGFVFDVGYETSERLSPSLHAALLEQPSTEAGAAALRTHFARSVWPVGRALAGELEALDAHIAQLQADAPTALVLEELAQPRQTRLFRRGSFLDPGEVVEPGVPAALGKLELAGESPRLAFARWLVARDNPLTARVRVNQLWALLFGRGLVETLDDFGTRGEAPSHAELLDWLALEFIESGWDQKALLARIVNSATYRQSSDVERAAYSADPANVRLARGARMRLEAELLRDNALAASELLVRTLGGPPVMPPQPPGVWKSAYSSDNWRDASGEARFRRGIYTFWKRTAPYLSFALFDAPSREVSCTRRESTSTPLQSLALLNDRVFVEASLGLARSALASGGDDAACAERMFRRCTSRRPSAGELETLLELLRGARAEFEQHPDAALQRVNAAAEHLPPSEVAASAAELASWMSVAAVCLALDDTLTRR